MGAVVSLAAGASSMITNCVGWAFGSCCASMACKACSCACVLPSKMASWIYLLLLVGCVVAGLSFGMRGGDIVIGGHTDHAAVSMIDKAREAAVTHASGESLWNSHFWCAKEHPGGWVICCADTCGGSFAVYRFSFVLCLFFSTLTLLTVGTSAPPSTQEPCRPRPRSSPRGSRRSSS